MLLFVRTRVMMTAAYSEVFSTTCVCVWRERESRCGKMLTTGEFRGRIRKSLLYYFDYFII